MTFQFKIKIRGTANPTVWRRALVPDTFTFEDFHFVIQYAFGWENDHLFMFSPKGYQSSPIISLSGDDDYYADETELKSIFNTEKQKYTYIYDFGDDWTHEIVLEKIIDDNVDKVRCIGGKGACPPEDCGGVWGYARLREILSDSSHPDYEDTTEWIGKDWDADAFDPGKVNFRHLNETIKDILEQYEMPKFNHPEVKQFYYVAADINREELQKIMALPRETLIEDMITMLKECVANYDYFSKYDINNRQLFFPIHALYVLSSLQAEEALEALLFVMNQKTEILIFWFDILLIDDFWQHLYWTGQNATDKLMTLFKSKNLNNSARYAIVTAITQIALQHPERKAEMAKWEAEAAEFMLENINDNDIFDHILFENLLFDLIIIGNIEYLPLVERCIAEGSISPDEIGAIDEIREKLLNDEIDDSYKYVLFTDINEFYDEWNDSVYDEFYDDFFDEFYDDEDFFDADEDVHQNSYN